MNEIGEHAMTIKKLELFNQYSREDIYKIFDGITPFTAGAGTWGIHGIVKIPKRKNDYVFFVTFGQKQLGHDFDEHITEDGILTWQSQPKQALDNPVIKNLINHNHLVNNIYLFLRTKKYNNETKSVEPFNYMGRVAYINHDKTREKPVFFKWQVINWETPSSNILTRMDLNLYISNLEIGHSSNKLILTDKPSKKSDTAKETRSFCSTKIDFIENAKKNTDIGLNGELLVLEYLQKELGYTAVHTSVIEGDGAGYDIEVIKEEDGGSLYIEVKTTKGGINTPFMITENELFFSAEYKDSYELYRVYEYNSKNNTGKLYKIKGDLRDNLNLNPTLYRAKI